MGRISEDDLILPALHLIMNKPGISTSELIGGLWDIFNPTGEDAAILKGRRDTKFSQIVRNLVAHKTLDERKEYAIYEHKGRNGYFQITKKGEDFLEGNQESLSFLIHAEFTYPELVNGAKHLHDAADKGRILLPYDENATVIEGRRRTVTSRVVERSRALRDAAIAHYTINGHITCQVCDFDFLVTYGNLGKGYIEIHHKIPLFQYDNEPTSSFLGDAVNRVSPLCSNCHRIVHRDRNNVLEIEELRKVVLANRSG